jgi:hypothetical protein
VRRAGASISAAGDLPAHCHFVEPYREIACACAGRPAGRGSDPLARAAVNRSPSFRCLTRFQRHGDRAHDPVCFRQDFEDALIVLHILERQGAALAIF